MIVPMFGLRVASASRCADIRIPVIDEEASNAQPDKKDVVADGFFAFYEQKDEVYKVERTVVQGEELRHVALGFRSWLQRFAIRAHALR